MMKHEHFIQECSKALFLNSSVATDPLNSLSNSAKPYKKFFPIREPRMWKTHYPLKLEWLQE